MTPLHAGGGRAGLDFLSFDVSQDFPIELLCRKSTRMAHRIELAMTALIMPPSNGMGRLRVLCVQPGFSGRYLYSGAESDQHGSLLADRVGVVGSRACKPQDLFFVLRQHSLDDNAPGEEILRLAIHNVALLVTALCDTPDLAAVYVSACVVLLSSMGSNPRGQALAEDFLRMWLRAEFGGTCDPPSWDHESAARLRGMDPWAGAFMEGLGESTRLLPPLRLPAEVGDVADASLLLRSHAILASCTPLGNA